MKTAIKNLESVGISLYNLESKVNELCWYVGGNENDIKDFQKMLTSLGIKGQSGTLKVDGTFGKETLYAWNDLTKTITSGTIPSLGFINPLQSATTNIKVEMIQGDTFSLRDYSYRSSNVKGTTVFRADAPHGNFQYHINTVEGKTIKSGKYVANNIQLKNLNKLNHFEVSESTYNVLKKLDGSAKVIRTGGRVLLVAGIALDALELGKAIEADLNDADKKLGKTTASSAINIAGRWGGSVAGAKVGAMGGAAIGTAVMPGVGTVIGGAVGGMVLGIVGAFGGEKLSEWVIDITDLGE